MILSERKNPELNGYCRGYDMCFFYSIRTKSKEIAKRYDKHTQLEIDFGQRKIAAGYDHPALPIIVYEEEVQYMEWGLIPTYIRPADGSEAEARKAVEKAAKVRKSLYNARSDKIFDTYSYRNLIYSNRCLIPSTGYFEYHYWADGTNSPFILYLKSLGIFSMGGLYNIWQNPLTGETVPTFTMITTEANELARKIHNGGKNPFRMPLVLPKGEETRWLDPNLTREEITSLMRPYDDADMEARQVSKAFKEWTSDDPGLW